VPCLLAALEKTGQDDPANQISIVEKHVRLTHQNKYVVDAARGMTQMLIAEATIVIGEPWWAHFWPQPTECPQNGSRA